MPWPMVHVMLRARRVELGLSQDEVARRCGTSQGHFGLWEAGQAVPRYTSMAKWASALGLVLTFDLNEMSS
jgi:transcriptional regulator with XRE-family HTH domain